MCPFLQLPGNGLNQSVLPPRSLGRLWLQAADVDVTNAPELVTKRTFLEFDLGGKSRTLTRCSSDGNIKYGSDSRPHVPQWKSFTDSRVQSPTSSPGCCPAGDWSFLSCCALNPDVCASNGHSPAPQNWSSLPANVFVAVPVFVPAAQPTMPNDILAALNAKKAAFGDTVARLSLAALKAEAPAPATAKKPSSTRTTRRAKRTLPNTAPNTESQMLSNDNIEVLSSSSSEIAVQTTIMLRNLPLQYTRTMLLDLLDSEGFNGRYDFVYLPSNFETSVGFGYAFVNFVSEDDAEVGRQHFQGFNMWSMAGEEVCETSWSDPYQGLVSNVERYRNSPVMHENVDDKHKPILFAGGIRQTFPAPSKLIKPPKTVHRSIPLQNIARPKARDFSSISSDSTTLSTASASCTMPIGA